MEHEAYSDYAAEVAIVNNPYHVRSYARKWEARVILKSLEV